VFPFARDKKEKKELSHPVSLLWTLSKKKTKTKKKMENEKKKTKKERTKLKKNLKKEKVKKGPCVICVF